MNKMLVYQDNPLLKIEFFRNHNFKVPEHRDYTEFREAQKSKCSYFSHIYKSCLAKVSIRWSWEDKAPHKNNKQNKKKNISKLS